MSSMPSSVSSQSSVLSTVSLEDAQGGGPVREGFLHKMGERNTAWKRRWFVLEGGALRYYKKAGDAKAGKEPKGEIPVEGCSVEFVGESKYDRKFCFELHSPKTKRVYVLSSEEGSDVQEWLSAIHRLMLKIRRQKSRAAAKSRGVDALLMEQDEAAQRRLTEERAAAGGGAAGGRPSGRPSESFRLPDGTQPPSDATDDQKYDMYMEWLQETQAHQRRGTVVDRGGYTMHEALLDGEQQEESGCGKCCTVM